MKDPYSVLGVDPTATDAEVKKAYRDLARKYHPDNYIGNDLADLAQEKMKEINEAYDEVNHLRRNKTESREGGAYGRRSAGWGGPSGRGSDGYAHVRQMIMNGQISEAEKELESLKNRDAEWYFLMGGVYFRKGWFDEAVRSVDRAVAMDPGNLEYRQAREQMRGGAYRRPAYGGSYGYPGQGGGMNDCDCCTSMLCAELCCGCGRSCC